MLQRAGPNSAIAPALVDMYGLVRNLFPIARSLTGDGVRETLSAIGALIALSVHEVPTGTQILDWEVPQEWRVEGARIRSMDGRVLVDFADNNLHLMGYSTPYHGVVAREVLAEHIHTLRDQPDVIPYRTGYFANNWGFCLTDALWNSMTDPEYRVEVDTELFDGALTYAEYFLAGETADEILLSVHICHPSLANDNLSSLALATALAQYLESLPRRKLGVRILFVPGTLGSLAWLSHNEEKLVSIKHGLVLTCVGDEGAFHYKKSRTASTVDIAVDHVLRTSGLDYRIMPFSPYGYDERQYCSPGFDLPVGCLMRAVHGMFPEYHTSRDNCDFVTPAALEQSLTVLKGIVDLLDGNRIYRRTDGRGEPQLGRRGLYRAIAGQSDGGGASQMDLLWLLNLADGHHSLLAMAERAQLPFARLVAAAKLALNADLIYEVL